MRVCYIAPVVWTLCDPLEIAARLFCPWDSAGKSTGMNRQCPPPGDLPDPGIPLSPSSPALQAASLPPSPPGKPQRGIPQRICNWLIKTTIQSGKKQRGDAATHLQDQFQEPSYWEDADSSMVFSLHYLGWQFPGM